MSTLTVATVQAKITLWSNDNASQRHLWYVKLRIHVKCAKSGKYPLKGACKSDTSFTKYIHKKLLGPMEDSKLNFLVLT